jgi:hypothetical protein
MEDTKSHAVLTEELLRIPAGTCFEVRDKLTRAVTDQFIKLDSYPCYHLVGFFACLRSGKLIHASKLADLL